MCSAPHLSPHTVIIYSLHGACVVSRFSCKPTRASNPSTSCCNCIYHAAHFSAPHGLGHSLHIPCNVENWSGSYPAFLPSCCCFFLAAICCGTLVGTDLVMLMACSYVAAVGAPSCPSCDLLCNIVSPLNFRCRSPPLRFLCRDRWRHNPMAPARPIVATAQYP